VKSPAPLRVKAPAEDHPSFGQRFNFISILAIHGATIYAFSRGVTWKLALLAFITYFVRMFAVTGVYHRYFSHKSYKTSRAFQLFLAVLGTSATQKGPLWWASVHRVHHKHSDTEKDVHSPIRRGFWYSHMGWWLGREHVRTDHSVIPDFAGYPELRWVDEWHWVGVFALILGTSLFGFDAFLWGYVVSSVPEHEAPRRWASGCAACGRLLNSGWNWQPSARSTVVLACGGGRCSSTHLDEALVAATCPRARGPSASIASR
jgi:stearoyl-CoA desaturase (delta-9 desaturase)